MYERERELDDDDDDTDNLRLTWKTKVLLRLLACWQLTEKVNGFIILLSFSLFYSSLYL